MPSEERMREDARGSKTARTRPPANEPNQTKPNRSKLYATLPFFTLLVSKKVLKIFFACAPLQPERVRREQGGPVGGKGQSARLLLLFLPPVPAWTRRVRRFVPLVVRLERRGRRGRRCRQTDRLQTRQWNPPFEFQRFQRWRYWKRSSSQTRLPIQDYSPNTRTRRCAGSSAVAGCALLDWRGSSVNRRF